MDSKGIEQMLSTLRGRITAHDPMTRDPTRRPNRITALTPIHP